VRPSLPKPARRQVGHAGQSPRAPCVSAAGPHWAASRSLARTGSFARRSCRCVAGPTGQPFSPRALLFVRSPVSLARGSAWSARSSSQQNATSSLRARGFRGELTGRCRTPESRAAKRSEPSTRIKVNSSPLSSTLTHSAHGRQRATSHRNCAAAGEVSSLLGLGLRSRAEGDTTRLQKLSAPAIWWGRPCGDGNCSPWFSFRHHAVAGVFATVIPGMKSSSGFALISFTRCTRQFWAWGTGTTNRGRAGVPPPHAVGGAAVALGGIGRRSTTECGRLINGSTVPIISRVG
jgi:hypothetical protein